MYIAYSITFTQYHVTTHNNYYVSKLESFSNSNINESDSGNVSLAFFLNSISGRSNTTGHLKDSAMKVCTSRMIGCTPN